MHGNLCIKPVFAMSDYITLDRRVKVQVAVVDVMQEEYSY